MDIAVCLKYVPDLDSVDVDPITGEVDESRLLYLINPADESALELALEMKTSGQVSVYTVGPPRDEAALREALAAGVDQVERLWDQAWTNTHPLRTAAMLAGALKADGLPDVILCGTHSDDRGSGQVPALLAEHLGWPVITNVTFPVMLGDMLHTQAEVEGLPLQADLLPETDPDTARVFRRMSRGMREEVTVKLPVVLALEPDLLRLRHASLPNLMMAQRAEIPVRSPADLNLSSNDFDLPRPVLVSTSAPRPRPQTIFTPNGDLSADERIAQILSAGVTRDSGRIIEGSSDEMTEAIVTFLQERGFLGQDSI